MRPRVALPRATWAGIGFLRWHGDERARVAVSANRNRLRSEVGKESMRRRAEIAERSFAPTLERGGMRRTWLRGRENVHKRYLIHVCGPTLGLLMRYRIGAGTPKEAAARRRVLLLIIGSEEILAIVLLAVADRGGEGDCGLLVLAVTTNPA